MTWEIQVREFAVMKLRRFVVGVRCFFPCFEQAGVDASAPDVDSGTPSVFTPVPADSFEATGIVRLWSPIALVLAIRTSTQIAAAIIELVMVSVIYGFTVFGFRYFSVHENRDARWVPSIRKISDLFCTTAGPIPLRQPLKISRVHNRVLTPRKRNEPIRFIRWLDDHMTPNRESLTQAGHGFSTKELNFNTGGALLAG